MSGGIRLGKADRKLLAWIGERGTVTIADLLERSGGTIRSAFGRLRDLEDRGLLIRSGGGRGEAFRWGRPDMLEAVRA